MVDMLIIFSILNMKSLLPENCITFLSRIIYSATVHQSDITPTCHLETEFNFLFKLDYSTDFEKFSWNICEKRFSWNICEKRFSWNICEKTFIVIPTKDTYF